MKLRPALTKLITLMIAVAVSGCAGGGVSSPVVGYLGSSPKPSEPQEIADPNEESNRFVFESNQKFYKSVGMPAGKAYADAVPSGVRDSIESFTNNLAEPVTFANNVLQLRPEAAAKTFVRFAVNSTVGLGGLFDVAMSQNVPRQTGDFGQTLYIWGIRESPYLVLPLLGPTNVRDALGNGLELVARAPVGVVLPTRFATVVSGAGSLSGPVMGLGRIEDLKALEESSLDFYVAMRSITDQKRQAELKEALSTSLLSPSLWLDEPASSPASSAGTKPADATKRAAGAVAAPTGAWSLGATRR